MTTRPVSADMRDCRIQESITLSPGLPVKQGFEADLGATLRQYGQAHLLDFVGELTDAERSRLLAQIASIDFPQLAALHASHAKKDHWCELARRAEPPHAFRLGDCGQGITRSEAIRRGEKAIAEDEIAMVLVAGGQGTRLGFCYPKGMLPVGPLSERTLFQIHIDKLKAIYRRFGRWIPFYVMTSPATHDEAATYLEAQDWFGYPREFRKVFCQGSMPAVDIITGRVLLAARGEISLAPDGHGGMLAAMNCNGVLDELAARNIRHVSYCQVDNPLAQICDPAMIGYHILAGSEMSSQAICKHHPLQKVGNLVTIDGRLHIIEYSDLPDTVAHRRNPDGSLALWAGSIAVHVFSTDFLQRVAGQANALPFHTAYKKVSWIDIGGDAVHPAAPNAVKFERFVFDLLPMAHHAIVVEVDPVEAFSPVKNAAGESHSTVRTAQEAMIDQARRALLAIGVKVAEGTMVEVSPALLADPALLRERIGRTTCIEQPVYIC
jgi:UDP-N-acetylglucosamine/UDP-N-acetylgalactosamine diphosphorylase